MVVLDKTRAWRYLHVVAALNWWKAAFYRHAWGDKDTWALAAVALERSDAAAAAAATAPATTAGSRVGWLADVKARPPTAVWGHMQFREEGAARLAATAAATVTDDDDDGDRDGLSVAAAGALLYLNYQPHYAAGFVDFQAAGSKGGVSDAVQCCVLLEDHWAGPHLEPRLLPSIRAGVHAPALDAAFGAARDAMTALGAEQHRPHWLGQVRYRRCAIYFALLGLAAVYTAVSAAALLLRPGARRRRRA